MHRSYFEEAPQAAYPELRRRKAASLRSQPFAKGLAQGEVWTRLADKSARLGVRSAIGAQSDIYRSLGDEIGKLRPQFPLAPGQCGAVFSIGGAYCLDWVSRPEAFAALYAKLLDGYLLDELESQEREPANFATLEEFIERVSGAWVQRSRSVGLGDDLRIQGTDVIGSGLELNGERLQLSAYSTQ